MTKKDLNDFYSVKLRNGDIDLILKNGLAKEGYGTFKPEGGCRCYMEEYHDDLTHKHCELYDIVAVRKPDKNPSMYTYIRKFFNQDKSGYTYKWDWERKEVEEMTLEEVCKALGKEIKIVK